MRRELSVVSMLLGLGWPAMAEPPTYSTQRMISAQADLCFDVRSADVDRDGDLDILSASYDGLIAWWENDGGEPPGPWTKHVVTVFADGAHAVFAAPIDGDADLDFLTATFNTAEVVWFENGSLPDPWSEHEISFDAPFASDVWSADLDGDDDPDVIVNFDGYIDWYEHDGTPTPRDWVKHVISPFPGGGLSVQAADIDRDGDLDLVSGGWYENDGAPDPAFTYRPFVTFPTAQASSSILAIDLDRDGDLDILSAEADRIAWHENDGGSPPGWTSRAISTARDFVMAVFAADLDGDTDVDVLSASFDDDTIAWYENDGGAPPSFDPHTITAGAWGARTVHAADVDADGDVDVLSGTQRDHDIVWYVNELDYPDTDADGMRDELDCAPADATAHATPGAIQEVRFDAARRLTWTTEAFRSGSGTRYDVLRGRIDELPIGSGPEEACAVEQTPAEGVTLDPPPAGVGYFYVVRGRNACGVGTYGFASDGAERVSLVCP